MLYMRSRVTYIFHHIVISLAMLCSYHFGVGGHEALIAVWLGEVTNPFLQLRRFLRTTTWETATVINDVILGVLFCRQQSGIVVISDFYRFICQ